MSTENTQGSLTKEAVRLAWPAVCESFLIALAGMVDTFMVSTLGANAVAAVGLTTQPKFLGLALFIAANVAISALVARRFGEKRQQAANEILVMTIVFCIAAAVLISALTVGFADQIIEFCGSNEDTHAMAARYYRIIMGGMIFNVLSMGINAAQRGAGRHGIYGSGFYDQRYSDPYGGILYFRVYSGTGNDRYLDGHSGGSDIQISVCVDSVPTGKMGDN